MNGDTLKLKKTRQEIHRKYSLKAKYGLATDEYEALYKNQEGRCAICLLNFDTLHVDHNHCTGSVRGLLCRHCNMALGVFKDDTKRLLRAVSYLKEAEIKDSKEFKEIFEYIYGQLK